RYLGYCHETLLQYLYHRCVMLPMETADRLLYQLHVLAAEFPEPVKDGTVMDLQLRPRRLLGSLVAANDLVLGRALAELESAERAVYRRDMNHPRSQQRWAARGSLKTGHLTLPMVLALVLAPVATSVAGRFTGGDKKRSDCYAEFEVENVATASKVECMEGTA